jgi:hypothetical protein
MMKKTVFYRVSGGPCQEGYVDVSDCDTSIVFDMNGAEVTGAVLVAQGDCPQEVVVVTAPPPPPPPPPEPVFVAATSCDPVLTTDVQVDNTLSQAVHTVPGTALQVKLCDPVANLKLEFSETKLYSASSELGLFRIREYNEDAGAWALRYENLDGTPFTGALPADLTATSAQVNVTRDNVLGCAEGVPYLMRVTSRFDAETGVLEDEVVDWVDSAGNATTAAPAGFVLGACPDVCEVTTPVGVVPSWG